MTRRKVDLARRRLAAQHLLTPTLTDPAEVVRRLGAVQAQDYGSAKWGVGTRTRGAVDAVVERAVNEGSILRTHVLRPTWHFALLEERVPPTAPLDRDAALLELTGRYFATRGPATVQDFAWWAGLSMADARRGVEIAAAEALGDFLELPVGLRGLLRV